MSANKTALLDPWRLVGKSWLPPLVIPQKVSYNDDGTISLSPFLDLKPTVMPSNVTTSGSPVAINPPMDRTDAILMLLGQIAKKLGVQ